MRAFRVAGLTAVAYLSKLLVSLFIIKEISVVHGPAGLGLLGNFMSLVSMASVLAGGGILSGIIKYLAEFTGSSDRQACFASNALIYTLFFAFLVLIVGILLIAPFTRFIFLNHEYQGYLYFFLVAQVLVSLNNFSVGVANGLGKNGIYTAFFLIGNVMAFVVAYYGIRFFGTWGAVVAIMAPTVCPFVPALFLMLKKRLFKHLQFRFFGEDGRLLVRFSAMRYFSALCFPIVEIIITNQISRLLGVESAGFWQSVTKLSTAYLSFYSMFLTFYFLPLVSPISDKKRIVNKVNKMLLLLSGTFVLMILGFFVFKNLIIRTVLSEQFLPMGDLMGLQMIGDFFRVLGWVIGFVAVSKAAIKLYLLGEFFQGVVFVILSHYALAATHDLSAVIMMYVLTSILYCTLSLGVFYIFFVKSKVGDNHPGFAKISQDQIEV